MPLLLMRFYLDLSVEALSLSPPPGGLVRPTNTHAAQHRRITCPQANPLSCSYSSLTLLHLQAQPSLRSIHIATPPGVLEGSQVRGDHTSFLCPWMLPIPSARAGAHTCFHGSCQQSVAVRSTSFTFLMPLNLALSWLCLSTSVNKPALPCRDRHMGARTLPAQS